MFMTYEIRFLISLFFALIVEIPIVLLLIKYFYKHKDINSRRIIFIGFIATSLTMPYIWFVLPAVFSNRGFYVLLSEISAIFIEGFIYAKLLSIKTKEAFTISFIANISSALLSFCSLF